MRPTLKSEGEELAERLVRALEAGRDAGGQVAGQHSAALLVVQQEVLRLGRPSRRRT